jgi:taurine dioxygenase
MHLGYERLSEQMQLRRADGVHDISRFCKTAAPADLHENGAPPCHPQYHNLETNGRAVIYVNTAFNSHIEGLSAKESDWLLIISTPPPKMPETQCRSAGARDRWSLWDNRVCQHLAVSDYRAP